MHDPRRNERPELPSDASKSAGESPVESTVPLDAGAFASPLAWPSSQQGAAKTRYRQAAIVLVSAAVLATGAVGMAVLISSRRAAVPGHAQTAAAVALRAEAPSEARMQRAPSRVAERAPATLTTIPRTPVARAPSGSASTTATPPTETGSVSAQPTSQAVQVARSKRAPVQRRARAERPPRTSQAAPGLPHTPTRAEVIAAMRKITPAVDACFGSTHGKANVSFSVIGKTGRVVAARVTGKTGKVGSCIARSVRRARFPKFEKPRIEISYPFAR